MQANGFKRLHLSGWRQFQHIDIELHDRLTIITGANGAGKSTILSLFTRHFGYNRNYLGTPTTKGGILSFVFDIFRGGRQKTSQPIPIGEIEYASGQKAALRLPAHAALNYAIEISNQQHVAGLHIDSHRPPNIYRHVASFPATPPSADGIGDGLNGEYQHYYSSGSINAGSLHHIKMTLIQMSIFGHGNSTMEPVPKLVTLFEGFEEKLRVLLPKSLGFKRLVIRSPEVLLSTTSGDFLLDAASGGVIKMFEVAWQIYFYSQRFDRFVLTFDEPENHLHPSMQKSFLPNIISAFPNIQIIAVTHSPFIISAMQDSAVYVLRYEDSEVSVEGDDDETIKGLMGSRVIAQRLDTVNKAGTASEILRDVLGISATIPDWAERRIAEIVASYKGSSLTDGVLKQLFSQLEKEGLASSYPEALSNLSRPQ